MKKRFFNWLFAFSFLFVVVMSVFVVKFSGSDAGLITGFVVHDVYSGFSAAEEGFEFDNSSRLVSVNDTIIYKTGYYSVNGSAWQSFTLSGEEYGAGSNWKRGDANYSLPDFGEGEHYIIVYSCLYNYSNASWDCHDNNWQLIVVDNSEEICNDTCSSLGYECGTHTVCGSNIVCGSCSGDDICVGGVCEATSYLRTFYISVSGDDSTGNGSLSNPWRTLYKACTNVNESGDLIYVTAGTYDEVRQCPLAAGVSMMGEGDTSIITSSSESLTYEGYPFSTDKRVNESIIAAISTTFGDGNQSISHIKFDGSDLNAARAFIIMNRNNFKIHDCTFVDFNYSAIWWVGDDVGRIGSEPYDNAIYPNNYATGSEFYNNNVSNCALNIPGDWGRGAVFIQDHDGILIYNNVIIQSQRPAAYNGYPIKSGFIKGAKLYNNTFIKIDSGSGTWMFAIEGFFYEGVEVYNNTLIGTLDVNFINKTEYEYGLYVHDNVLGPEAPSSTAYKGLTLEFSTSDVIIERNMFRYCNYSISLTPRSGCTIKNYRIAYNTFSSAHSQGYYLSGGSDSGLGFMADNVSFYNNVFNGSALWGLSLFGTWNNFNFVNNIITGTGYYFIGFRENVATNITITNNVIYNCAFSNNPYFATTPVNYVNTSNIMSSPLFINAATGDFHLQSSSPAINNGTDVGLTSDYEGNVIVGVPDIGAFEYQPDLGNLTVNNAVGGTTTGNATNFVVPANKTITATANTNYSFVNWSRISGNCTFASATISNTTVQVTGGSCVVQANFVESAGESTFYYISTAGNDTTGNGSYSAPWRTLYKACSSVTTFGETIYVTAGTYEETNRCDLAVGVNILGEGDTSIISYDTFTEWYPVIRLYSSTQGTHGNQTISHIKMDGNNVAWGAIQINTRSYVKIHDCTFVNFFHEGVEFNAKIGSSTGPPTIFAVGNEFYNNNLTNCSEYNGSSGYGELMFGGQDGMKIYNNYMDTTDRGTRLNGYNIKYCSDGYNKGFEIYNNTLIMADYGASNPFYDFSIELWHTQGGAKIYNNTMTGGIDFGGGTTMVCLIKGDYDYGAWVYNNVIGPDEMISYRTCIYLERNTEYAIIEKNLFKNCYNGVTITPSAGENVSQHIIRYNLFQNIGFYGIRYQYGTSSVGANVTYLDFFNNVFYVGTGGGIVGIGIPTVGNASYINITNNVIQGATYAAILAHSTVGQSLDYLNIQNNIFYGNGYSNVPRFENLTPTNYVNSDNMLANPLFVDASNGDFHLQSTSPAIDNGTDVGLTEDFDGNSIVGTQDIGAYEYTGD